MMYCSACSPDFEQQTESSEKPPGLPVFSAAVSLVPDIEILDLL
jgi:hypothetical protein